MINNYFGVSETGCVVGLSVVRWVTPLVESVRSCDQISYDLPGESSFVKTGVSPLGSDSVLYQHILVLIPGLLVLLGLLFDKDNLINYQLVINYGLLIRILTYQPNKIWKLTNTVTLSETVTFPDNVCSYFPPVTVCHYENYLGLR
jgi:hypothetical protein